LPAFFSLCRQLQYPSVSPRTAYAQRGTNTLQHVLRDHLSSFAADYDARYAKKLGNFRIERISRAVQYPAQGAATRFLACGDYPLSGSGVYSRRVIHDGRCCLSGGSSWRRQPS
jgi:hypothetical protein